ncbi:hypothetical protein, partial [Photobacterium sp. R1]
VLQSGQPLKVAVRRQAVLRVQDRPERVLALAQIQVAQIKLAQANQINPWLMKCWQQSMQHGHRARTAAGLGCQPSAL